MTIKRKEDMPKRRIEIDLTGPDGNAFALMGYARTLAKQMDMNSAPVITEMMAGDYENLVEVFDKHFGVVVDLIR